MHSIRVLIRTSQRQTSQRKTKRRPSLPRLVERWCRNRRKKDPLRFRTRQPQDPWTQAGSIAHPLAIRCEHLFCLPSNDITRSHTKVRFLVSSKQSSLNQPLQDQHETNKIHPNLLEGCKIYTILLTYHANRLRILEIMDVTSRRQKSFDRILINLFGRSRKSTLWE
jgi:hypothetical protein